MPMMIQVPLAMQQQQRHEFVVTKIPGSFDDFSFRKCMSDILPCRPVERETRIHQQNSLHRRCSNQNSRVKTTSVSNSSSRIHFRSFEVMSLTLAFPNGGPLNNCIPMVLGTIANSTAQTGMQARRTPLGLHTTDSTSRKSCHADSTDQRSRIRSITLMMPLMSDSDHGKWGKKKNARDHAQPVVPASIVVQVVVSRLVHQSVIRQHEIRIRQLRPG